MFERPATPPQWVRDRDARPRVVIENADPAQQWVEAQILHEAGYDVLACGGPSTLAGDRCPVVEGRPCAGIAETDVVVSSLRVEGKQGREVIRGLRSRYPDTPIVVEAPPPAVEDYADVLSGCLVVYPLTTRTLLEALRMTCPVSEPGLL